MTDLIAKGNVNDGLKFYDPLDDGEPITELPPGIVLIGAEAVVQFLNDLGNDVSYEMTPPVDV